MKRIAIIAALPGELRPLVKGWKQIDAAGHIHHWESELHDAKWIAVCAGIGKAAATRAFAEAEKEGPLTAVLSIGWAGALSDGHTVGQVCNMAQVLDTQTGEQYQLVTSNRKLKLLTTSRVAGQKEKLNLGSAYPDALLVDMEAAAVARMAATRNLPCFCFKAISDRLNDRLPDLNPYIDQEGQFDTSKFILSSSFKPAYWSTLVRFRENSRRAAASLAQTVEKFLTDEDYTRDNR